MAVYFNALQNDYEAEDIRKFSYVVRNLQSYDFDNNSMIINIQDPEKDYDSDSSIKSNISKKSV